MLTRRQLVQLLRRYSVELQTATNDLPLRLRLAEVLRLLERHEEAVTLYSSVAWAHAVAGNLVQAIMVCKVILEISPKHERTQEMLAKLYASKAVRDEKSKVPVSHVGDRWIASAAAEQQSLAGSGNDETRDTPSNDEETAAETPSGRMQTGDTLPRLEVRSPAEEALRPRAVDTPEPEAALSSNNVQDRHHKKPPLVAKKQRGGRSLGDTLRDSQLEAGELEAKSSSSTRAHGLRPLSSGDIAAARARADRRSTEPMEQSEISNMIRKDAEIAFDEGHVTDGYPAVQQHVLNDGIALPEAADVDAEAAHAVLSTSLCGIAPNAPESTSQIALPQVALFSDLPLDAFIAVVEELEARIYRSGEWVLRQGDAGDSLFIVSSGKLEVLRHESGKATHLAFLGPGAFFGEFALLADRHRHASVLATTMVEVLELRRPTLARLVKDYPSIFTTLRHFYEKRVLDATLKTSPIFQVLDPGERERVVGKFQRVHFAQGQTIVREGSTGNAFYILLSGHVAVFRQNDSREEVVQVGALKEGDFFGEMSLLSGSPTAATVRAKRHTELLKLEGDDFLSLAARHPKVWSEAHKASLERASTNEHVLARQKAAQLLL